jgi:hypothetical protein
LEGRFTSKSPGDRRADASVLDDRLVDEAEISMIVERPRSSI